MLNLSQFSRRPFMIQSQSFSRILSSVESQEKNASALFIAVRSEINGEPDIP